MSREGVIELLAKLFSSCFPGKPSRLCLIGSMGGEARQDKLLNDPSNSASPCPDCRVGKHQPDSTIGVGVVEVGKGTRTDVAQKIGIVWHCFSAVTTRDDRGTDGVNKP